MRHKKIGRKFNRNSSHRKSMFKNMVISLINFEIIKTTLFKAKELRRIFEPLLNLSKKNNLFNRRLLISKIGDKNIVNKLFFNLAPRFKNYKGGYLRILKCGFRKGDCSPMAYVEILNKSLE